MTRKIVLQAIDSPRRDTEWRVFLAFKLAKAGFASVIAGTREISEIHERSRNCIYLGRLPGNTGRRPGDRRLLDDFSRHGTALFFLHDEGGFYFEGEYEAAVKRVYPEELLPLPVLERMFFWGAAQREVMESGEHAGKMMVTGAPRFDLCRSEYAHIDREHEERLRERYGRFLLVCGRFAAVNMVWDDPSVLGTRSYDIRVEGGAMKDRSRDEILQLMFQSWGKVCREFSEFVPAIARLAMDFPDVNLVVRPHPAERISFYKEAFAHFPNVFVDKDGDVRALIRACDAVIHSECTTAVEAEMAQKPSANFRPAFGVPEFQPFTICGVSDLGRVVGTYEELKHVVDEFRASGYRFERSGFDVSRHLVNSRAGTEASELIVEQIEEFAKRNHAESKLRPRPPLSLRSLKRALKGWLLAGARGPARNSSPGDSKMFQYAASDLQRFWRQLGGAPGGLEVRQGVVYTHPERERQ